MNVSPKRKAKVIVVAQSDKERAIFEQGKVFFSNLAFASDVVIQDDKDGIEDDFVSLGIPGAAIYIPFNELVDIEKEIARLQGEQKKLQDEVDRIIKKLSNTGFVSKAPEAVILGEKEKQATYEGLLVGVSERLSKLLKA